MFCIFGATKCDNHGLRTPAYSLVARCGFFTIHCVKNVKNVEVLFTFAFFVLDIPYELKFSTEYNSEVFLVPHKDLTPCKLGGCSSLVDFFQRSVTAFKLLCHNEQISV